MGLRHLALTRKQQTKLRPTTNPDGTAQMLKQCALSSDSAFAFQSVIEALPTSRVDALVLGRGEGSAFNKICLLHVHIDCLEETPWAIVGDFPIQTHPRMLAKLVPDADFD